MLKRVLSVAMVSMLALGNISLALAEENAPDERVTVQDVVTVHDVVTVQDVDQEAKAAFKAKLAEMKAAIKAEYSEEELENIAEVTEELEAQGMDVLPVENVISKERKFKFDVPPVIKEGRTLIPVRAISEGFGAEVVWDEATKTVTITKDGATITLNLEEKTAAVNGQAIALDVPAEIMNNRTIVPLRFIAESMGLAVEWDADESVIEIED